MAPLRSTFLLAAIASTTFASPLLRRQDAANVTASSSAASATSSSGSFPANGTAVSPSTNGTASSAPINGTAAANVTGSPLADQNLTTLVPPTITGANCQNVTITVPVNATNYNITAVSGIPQNNSQVSGIITEYLSLGSPLKENFSSGNITVNETFTLGATLCVPTNGNVSAVQFLQHGVGFDRSYWNFPLDVDTGAYPNSQSYVQVASNAGYATLAIDRLGVGESNHPDPINVVQTGVNVEITREINRQLRAGQIGNTTFSKVINVGHSYGSSLTNAFAFTYPNESDALVLTGFSFSQESIGTALAAFDFQIAANVSQAPTVLSIPTNVTNGYWSSADISNNALAFFRYPYYNYDVLRVAEATKQPLTVGEFFTLAGAAPAAQFQGPVHIVTGENDLVYAGGNASYAPVLEQTRANFTASRNASVYTVPNTGHGLNLANGAPQAFTEIQEFLKANGL